MIGRFLIFILSLLLFLGIPSTSYAHSGGTDSNGGHWNRSTGTYHFHHGYPAHDHTDTNGDGIADCPYENAKGCTSGGVTTSSGYTARDMEKRYDSGYNDGYKKGVEDGEKSGYQDGYSACESDLAEKTEREISEAISKDRVSSYSISAVITAIITMIGTGSHITGKWEEKVKAIKAEKDEEIKKAKKQLLLSTGKESQDDIPSDVTLKFTCLPIKGTPTKNRPYGQYTVYLTAGGKKFHCKYGCSNATNITNYFVIPDTMEPCKNCVPEFMKYRKIPDWYKDIR